MTDLKVNWVVVNIGCIECGVSSNIVGVFDDEAHAAAVADHLRGLLNWRQGGQNEFQVFPLPPVGMVYEEYADLVAQVEPTVA